jgi:hypothetical protein
VTCPRCGRENADDAKFCSNCGTDLTGGTTIPPPPPAPEVQRPRVDVAKIASAGWETASRAGSWAFLLMGLVGQVLAFILYGAQQASDSSTSISIVNVLRLGVAYFFGFHHVGITFSGAIPSGDIESRFTFRVAFALLLVTGLAVYLLCRAGRRVAESTGGTPWQRAIHGAKVGVPYALLSLILSFVIPFDIPSGTTGGTNVHLGVAHLGAFLIPLLIGAAAGAFGGLLSARGEVEERGRYGRHAVAAVVAGARMFLYGLVFSFVGLLVMAALHPDLTSRVVRAETSAQGGYGAGMLNHILVLPNQSMWVLIPAMGGCDGAYGGGGPASVKFDFLCYTHFPNSTGTSSLGGFGTFVSQPSSSPTLPFGFGTAPAAYFLFLLVPAAAVFIGGGGAARRFNAATREQGLLVGALAGVVFAALVTAGAWLAGIGVSAGGGALGFNIGVSGHIGPRIGSALLFGLLWGVVGGAIGGAVAVARQAPAAPLSLDAGVKE